MTSALKRKREHHLFDNVFFHNSYDQVSTSLEEQTSLVSVRNEDDLVMEPQRKKMHLMASDSSCWSTANPITQQQQQHSELHYHHNSHLNQQVPSGWFMPGHQETAPSDHQNSYYRQEEVENYNLYQQQQLQQQQRHMQQYNHTTVCPSSNPSSPSRTNSFKSTDDGFQSPFSSRLTEIQNNLDFLEKLTRDLAETNRRREMAKRRLQFPSNPS